LREVKTGGDRGEKKGVGTPFPAVEKLITFNISFKGEKIFQPRQGGAATKLGWDKNKGPL